MRSLRLFRAVIILAFWASSGLAQTPDLALVAAELRATQNAEPSLAELKQQVTRLRDLFDLAEAPKTEPAAGASGVQLGKPQVSSLNLRVALAKLAIYAGTNQQLALIKAQAGQNDAIILRGGSATLEQVLGLAKEAGIKGITRDATGIMLTRPLIVWDDAELRIRSRNSLNMNSDLGAFVLSFGHLSIDGANVSATTPTSGGVNDFRAFILVAGSGSLSVDRARFVGLGSGETSAYGGLGVISGGLFKSDRVSTITNSHFENSGPINLTRTSASTISGNSVIRSRGVGLILIGIDNATVAANIILSTQGLQSVRVTAASRQIKISGNIVARGRNSGVLIDRNVTGVDFLNNSMLSNGAGGLRIRRSGCVKINTNLILANDGPGIILNQTRNVVVARNAIVLNDSSGITISNQPERSATRIAGNLIAGNAEGLRGATAGHLALSENILDHQYPRLFSGDLATHTGKYLLARQVSGQQQYNIGSTDAQMDASGCEAV